LEKPGGRSFHTANTQLCSLRRHKAGILFAELTMPCWRVLPPLLGAYRHGRHAQVCGPRVDESQRSSRPFILDLRYRRCRSGFIDGGKR
jgi:hypothetical protein